MHIHAYIYSIRRMASKAAEHVALAEALAWGSGKLYGKLKPQKGLVTPQQCFQWHKRFPTPLSSVTLAIQYNVSPTLCLSLSLYLTHSLLRTRFYFAVILRQFSEAFLLDPRFPAATISTEVGYYNVLIGGCWRASLARAH